MKEATDGRSVDHVTAGMYSEDWAEEAEVLIDKAGTIAADEVGRDAEVVVMALAGLTSAVLALRLTLVERWAEEDERNAKR